MKNTAKKNAYDLVTTQVLDLMEQGVTPWRKTWKGSTKTDGPVSISTGKPYQGINEWILWMAAMEGHTSRFWGTYNAIKKNGGQVNKGEKGTTVVFWKFLPLTDKETGEVKTIPFLRHFTVFNTCQADWADGLPEKFQPVEDSEGEGEDFTPDEAAEAIVQGYLTGTNPPGFKTEKGGDRAFYAPKVDSITVPAPEGFDGSGEYYSTVFHELGHSTGHADRLKRKGVVDFDGFGSHQYSQEELVAEFTACFLCGDAGILDTRENSAAYLRNWAKAIKGNQKLIVMAAAQAAKAATMIRNGGALPVKPKEEATA